MTSINLSWQLTSDNLDRQEIHRSTKLHPQMGGELVKLADLDKTADTYVDPDTVYGETYFYQIRSLLEDEVANSLIIEAQAVPWTGPGPQVLMAGDYDYGIYGPVDSSDFIPDNLIREMVYERFLYSGIATTRHGNATTENDWLKLSYRGRVMYRPTGFMFIPYYNNSSRYVSCRTLIESGLYLKDEDIDKGIHDDFIDAIKAVDIPENLYFTLKGNRYRIRLAEYRINPLTTKRLVDETSEPSEFRDLYLSLATSNPFHPSTVATYSGRYKPPFSPDVRIPNFYHTTNLNNIYHTAVFDTNGKGGNFSLTGQTYNGSLLVNRGNLRLTANFNHHSSGVGQILCLLVEKLD